MRLLENHSKELFARYGIPCPQGRICASAAEVGAAFDAIGPVAVKALVAAGRKGHSGGVLLGRTRDEAVDYAERLLGRHLLGVKVTRLWVEELIETTDEFFVAWTYSLTARQPVVVASLAGGVEVESMIDRVGAVARIIDSRMSFSGYNGRQMAEDLGIAGPLIAAFGDIVTRLGCLFVEQDAWLAEINPIALTADGRLIATGAAIEVDENASFRHPDWPADERELSSGEAAVRAADEEDRDTSGVRFSELDGDIVYLVIGGGSGLTYMDYLTRQHGLRPANTIDVSPGRGLNKLQVAIRAALQQPRKRAVLFTIPHSNLARVAEVFNQFVLAFETVRDGWDESIPIVVRMSGDGEERAKEAAKAIPNCTFFGDEVTIEDAIDHLVRLIKRGADT